MPRNRAAQDVTLINLRAAKKRIANLEAVVGSLIQALTTTTAGRLNKRFARRLVQLQIRMNK